MAPKRPRQTQSSEQPEGAEAAEQGAAGRTRAKTKDPVGKKDKPDKAALAPEAAETKDKPSRSKAASKQQAQSPAPEAESKPAAKRAKKGDEPELVATVLDLSEGKRDKNGGCLQGIETCLPGWASTASYDSQVELMLCLSLLVSRPFRQHVPTLLS